MRRRRRAFPFSCPGPGPRKSSGDCRDFFTPTKVPKRFINGTESTNNNQILSVSTPRTRSCKDLHYTVYYLKCDLRKIHVKMRRRRPSNRKVARTSVS